MRLSLLAVLALSTASLAAHASPVTYSLSGTFSGSLGGASFTDTAAIFTFVGDTANINSLGSGYYTNSLGSGTIAIDGFGTATFLSSTFGALGEFGGAGFFDLATGFNVGIYDPALAGYDLSSSFTDSAYFVDGFTGVTGPESTSLGDLIITGGDSQHPTTTFTVSAVPEPSGIVLLGTGLLGAVGALRRACSEFQSKRGA